MAWNVQYHDALDSTNTHAWDLLSKGEARHGDVIQTGHQTGGRGRFNNRVWEDEPGASLLMSIVLTDINRHLLPLLSFIAGLAALRAMRTTQTGADGDRIRLKWPNDLLIDRKKVAGVLVENCWSGQELKGSVVGIGINVNQPAFEGPLSETATSMRAALNKTIPIEELRDSTLAELRTLLQLDRESTLKQIRRELEWMSNVRGLQVHLLEGIEYNDAQYRGISEDGALLIQLADRVETIYAATLRIPR